MGGLYEMYVCMYTMHITMHIVYKYFIFFCLLFKGTSFAAPFVVSNIKLKHA